jgi:hypothetical protein
MKSVVLQLGARKRSASSRWLGLRLLIDSFPVEMLREELRNSHDEAPAPPVAHHQGTGAPEGTISELFLKNS